MNFAKNLLGKYGWKEGDGLGRDKNGITKPLKANYKFDNAGLGHNPADDMNNHWWENVYNQAATNLNVATNESNEVKMGIINKQSVEITTKNYSVNKKSNSDYGGSFLKSATLTNEGQEVEFDHKETISPVILKIVSDEELFKACGGRTAHKGARHGLKLSGKLNRIEQQERELINKIQSATEDCSQVFREYADCKSRYNKKKLKRLHKKKSGRSSKCETFTSAKMLPVTVPSAIAEDEPMEELEHVQPVDEVEELSESMEESVEESIEREAYKKYRRNKLLSGRVDKRCKRKRKKKLRKLSKEMRVSDSKKSFMKKMAIEEVPISFESIKKSKKNQSSDLDDVSLHSYRCKDEQSQSDDENGVQKNILSQLSEQLQKVKTKKQKVIVENLTEFQMEHLRNAHVPYVEIKQSTRRTSRKNAAKFNNLANNLVNKMNIL